MRFWAFSICPVSMLRLDRLVLGQTRVFSIMAADALAAEQAHQVVLAGDEELGGAGVALTARAAAQLVVDAAGFVALGADDVQAAERRSRRRARRRVCFLKSA